MEGIGEIWVEGRVKYKNYYAWAIQKAEINVWVICSQNCAGLSAIALTTYYNDFPGTASEKSSADTISVLRLKRRINVQPGYCRSIDAIVKVTDINGHVYCSPLIQFFAKSRKPR